jgi:hypothetical protein
MPLTHHINRLNGVVVFDVQGEASLESLHELIDAVARSTQGGDDKRVLVNLLAVDEHLKFTDHYSLGEQVARKLGHLARLASVVRAERRTGTSEKVANAQGMQLRVFVSVPAAMDWLSTDRAAAG